MFASINGMGKRAVALLFLLAAMVSLQPAIAASGTKILKIDPREVVGFQYMPDEITAMLEDLGYEWQHVADPDRGDKVKMSRQYGQYIMQFRSKRMPGIWVDVHIRTRDSVTSLHVRLEDSQTPNTVFEEAFRKLETRAGIEFGPENVKESSRLLAP
jgi:hypothetical protein